MKKIILLALFAGISLVAAEAKSNGFVPINGAEIYQQYCVVCHGKEGKMIPTGASAALAGRDAEKLALTIRAYRDQDKSIGAFTMKKSSEIMKQATMELSDSQIGAVAKYISGLK